MLAELRVIPLLLPKVNEVEAFSVPPFKTILSASNEPGFGPRLSLDEMLTVPLVIVVVPEYVLLPERTRVPPQSLVKLLDPAIIPP